MSDAGMAKSIYNVGKEVIRQKDKEIARLKEQLNGERDQCEECGLKAENAKLKEGVEEAMRVVQQSRSVGEIFFGTNVLSRQARDAMDAFMANQGFRYNEKIFKYQASKAG